MLIRRRGERGFWIFIVLFVAVVVAAIVLSDAFDGDDGPTKANTDIANTTNTANSARSASSAAAKSLPFQAAGTLEPGMSPGEYLDRLFNYPDDPMTRLYLPNYSYAQGLTYARGNLGIYGQVRTFGGAVAAGPTSWATLGYGAMVTTNPEFLRERFVPETARYQILEWKLVD